PRLRDLPRGDGPLDLDRGNHHRGLLDLCGASRGEARPGARAGAAACGRGERPRAFAAPLKPAIDRGPRKQKEAAMKLGGHAALVTGGAWGLGAATARALAKAGAKVAVLDVNAAAAASVAKEIGGLAVACDVADAKSAEAAVAEAKSAHGAARVLINCAGI